MTLPASRDEHVLLFDLTQQAHVFSFLRHWLLWWERHRPPGRLSVVLDPFFSSGILAWRRWHSSAAQAFGC